MMIKTMKCINNLGREKYLTIGKSYEVDLINDAQNPYCVVMGDNDIVIATPNERFEEVN